jgi:hypothetical protein
MIKGAQTKLADMKETKESIKVLSIPQKQLI